MSTLERHYRVTLDFRVLVREITPEVCRESFFFNDENASAGEPHFRENIERQRRLYRLLRGNRQAPEQYLLSVLTQEVGNFVSGGLADAFDAADEDELLMPLYRRMNEEDALLWIFRGMSPWLSPGGQRQSCSTYSSRFTRSERR